MRSVRLAAGAAFSLVLIAPPADAQQSCLFVVVSGDFDEDGTPDLITARGSTSGSVIALHRGRPEFRVLTGSSKRPGSERTPSASAFLPAARRLELPGAIDLLGTGDFDGDGHLDVVGASRGGDELVWILGDGHGHFPRRKKTGLAGVATALVAGEVNRPDGLTDVVVAIDAPSGPKLKVFEWPTGALRAEPEVVALPAPATALALGRLDWRYEADLAVAAGREVLIVQGRDRRLSAFARVQEAVPPPAVVERIALPSAATALVAGDFGGDWRSDLAALLEDGTVRVLERTAPAVGPPRETTWRESDSIAVGAALDPDAKTTAPLLDRARVAGSARDAVVVLDPAQRRLHVVTRDDADAPGDARVAAREVEGAPAAMLSLRVNADALSDFVILDSSREEPTVLSSQPTRSFVINSSGDQSDPNLGLATDDHLCDVDLGTSGEQCTLRAALENAIATTRDAQFTFDLAGESVIAIGSRLPPLLGVVTIDGTLGGAITRVTLDGSGAGSGVNGLELRGGDSTVRSLRVTGFSGHGLLISGTPPPGDGNHIVEGCAFDGNGGHGVFIEGGTPNNTVRASEIAFNSGDGVHIGTPLMPQQPGGGNAVVDNPLIGRNGGHGVIDADTPTNTIRNNDVSRNGQDGVHLSGQAAQANLVQGNSIGTDGSNGGDAVVDSNAPQTTIGGAAGQGNNLAGANNGIRLEGGLLDGIRIVGNFLDQDQTGAKFDVGLLAVRSGKLLTVEGNFFEKLNASGASIKAHLDESTNYNFRQNRMENEMRLGTELTFEEGLTVNLDYSGNFHVGNDLALRLVESTGEVKLTSSDLQISGGTGTELMLKAKGEKSLTGWRVTGGGSVKLVADFTADVRATVRAEGMVIADSNRDAINGSFTGQGDLAFALINTQIQGSKADGLRFDVFGSVGAEVNVDISNSRMSGRKVTGAAGVRLSNRSASLDIVRAELTTSDFRDFDFDLLFFKVELRHTITGCTATGGRIGLLLDGGTLATISGSTFSGNTGAGLVVQGGSGGTLSGSIIAGNRAGAVISGNGPGMALAGNRIFGNSGLGIDLGDDGVTPNDPGDADVGPNGLQNFPVLTSVTTSAGGTRIVGSLNSAPKADFAVAFYANSACPASGFGQGEAFLGSAPVTTDASGNASFDVTFAGTAAAVAATATDAAGNTSEFSRCLRQGRPRRGGRALR
jgi:Right handed beta helix region/FG-GAP-like repeat